MIELYCSQFNDLFLEDKNNRPKVDVIDGGNGVVVKGAVTLAASSSDEMMEYYYNGIK